MFGSDFKLAVSRDSSTHFIFLERQQVAWLEGVLKVASSSKWVFPKDCSSRSTRRSISVFRCLVRGKPALKIVESCSAGKVFFVVIPSSTQAGDWRGFLNLSRELLSSELSCPSIPAGRTFAEVVGASRLSTLGRCSSFFVYGVQTERIEFLSKALVFRFSKPHEVVWESFRVWAAS
ncbi:hypothetical protein LINPERHAP1_LOCUS10211 [Linum perenne]